MAPLFVQDAQTAFNSSTTPKSTTSFDVLAGDQLIGFYVEENSSGSLATIGGTSMPWSVVKQLNTAGFSQAAIWQATVDVAQNLSASIARGSTVDWWGGDVLTFRNHRGIGASVANTFAGPVAPSLNITTLRANSAIVVVVVDVNTMDGSSRTWRTNAGTFTELPPSAGYFRDAAHYTSYAGYHANAGPAGTYAVGLTAPTTTKPTIIAVEIFTAMRFTLIPG